MSWPAGPPARRAIAEAVAAVRTRIAAAAARAGRAPSEVRLVTVTKGVPAEVVAEALAAGVREVGENRAQELRDKQRRLAELGLGGAAVWHFVGGLQTNKVRYLDTVQLLHSLDRLEEAEALQRRGERLGRSWDVLVEVNVSGEPTKQGIRPEKAEELLERLASFTLVRPRGIMTVAPQAPAEVVRRVFAEARALRDRLRERYGSLEELSMGMSDDFEVAVEEGATIVRIGRAIFQGVAA